MRLSVPTLLALASAALAADAPQRPGGFESRDLYRLQEARDVQLSPDGTRIAYSVLKRDRPGRPYDDAWIMDVATGLATRLGSSDASVVAPRWSPDGRLLAARAADPAGEALVVLRPDGTRLARLATLTETNHPLPATGERVAWSPDGRRIAFVSATPGPEPDPHADPVVITRYLFKPPASDAANRFNDNRRLHVFVADLATRAVRALTSGAFHEHSIAWTPGGEEVLFVSNREADADRVFNNDLFAVRVADGHERRITNTHSAEYAPAPSPDGRRIAYLATRRPLTSSETTMEDTHVWVADADGGNAHELAPALDDRQGAPRWSPDGRFVYTAVEEHGSVRLCRLGAEGGPRERVAPVAGEAGTIGSWSVAQGGALAFALATPAAPADLWLQTPSKDARRLTWLNRDWLEARPPAPVEPFTFRSFDGTELEAFLTRPRNAADSRRHPMIVVLHGGPHAQSGPAFELHAQVYAAEGWATLKVNYRGSTGYGQRLADAVFKDQDGAEAKDVLAAVDAALARNPWIDPDRLGVEGSSYGGQLANWLVTQTDRFRAAIPTAGISNLVSFNYTAYYHDYLAVEFGAWPHEGPLMDLLWERSPLRYVARVKTPVLFLHGENDNDVPIAEAEQFYVALKDVGVETVMVRYPREGHGLRESAHVVDALDRSIAWYRTHFAAAPRH